MPSVTSRPARGALRAWLAAALLATAGPVFAQAAPSVAAPVQDPAAQEPYGWPWLVRALDRLKPSTDTRVPETSSEAVARYEGMITEGRAAAALTEIDERLRQRAASNVSGVDARLLFLRGRALAAEGRLDEAAAVYERMTTDFPELPEPWNNLAAVYAANGQLERAAEALRMALLTQPDYPAAQANLADVQLMLAERAYAEAARQGNPDAGDMATRTRELIRGVSP